MQQNCAAYYDGKCNRHRGDDGLPGVINANKLVLDKINEANGLPVDGHAPGLKSCDLNAYISAGISSDHESIMLEEAMEKLSRGLYIMIREGSSEKIWIHYCRWLQIVPIIVVCW